MKYAVVSVSAEGARLGQTVKAALGGDGTCYERRGAESGEEALYFSRTFALTEEIFSQYEGILYIMASGIAVRAIAPYVVSKASDPAVLVMDECGKHCISLLSGHLGGANAWCREAAAAAGADPVITTATDVHGRLAPDDAARILHMRVEPLAALKPVNSAIAAGETFLWAIDPEVKGAASIRDRLSALGVAPVLYNENMECAAAAVVSERNLPVRAPHVYLRPENLFVGIGCKRDTPESLIRDAFEKAAVQAGIFPYQVKSLASVDQKADEKGLLSFASHMGLPIHFYPAEELRKYGEAHHVEVSKFVEKTIGVGNVCESAAHREALRGRTLLKKTKFKSVTIAITAGLSGSSALDRDIRKK